MFRRHMRIWCIWFFLTLSKTLGNMGDSYQIDGVTQNNNKTVIVKTEKPIQRITENPNLLIVTDGEIIFPDDLDGKQKEEMVNNTLRNTQVEVVSSGCHDNPRGSECCTTIKGIPFVYHMNDTLCINMTFKHNDTDLHYYITWNGHVELDGDLIDFTKRICVDVPLPKIVDLFQVCIYFTHFSRVNNTLNGCVNFELKIFSFSLKAKIGCFGSASASGKRLNSVLLATCFLIAILQCQGLSYSDSNIQNGQKEVCLDNCSCGYLNTIASNGNSHSC